MKNTQHFDSEIFKNSHDFYLKQNLLNTFQTNMCSALGSNRNHSMKETFQTKKERRKEGNVKKKKELATASKSINYLLRFPFKLNVRRKYFSTR